MDGPPLSSLPKVMHTAHPERYVVVEPPPFFARLGCGLLVGTLVAVLYTCVGVWLLAGTGYELAVNMYIGGPERVGDVLKVYTERMLGAEFRSTLLMVLSGFGGALVAAVLIAMGEAGRFLTWLRR